MNRINGTVEKNNNSYEYYILWEERNLDIVNNKSSVYAEVHIYCSNHSAYQNQGLHQTLWINGTSFEANEGKGIGVNLSAGTDIILVSGQVDNIYHESDGSKSINISASSELPSGGGWGPVSGTANEWVWLTQFARQANFTGYSVNAIGLNYVDIAYTLDKDVSSLLYSVNGGEWKNISVISGSWYRNAIARIPNLSPNTNYNFRLKATANGLETVTNYMYATTKDIAKISQIDNFNHGDNIHLVITNPSNISNLNLTIKIGNVEILTRQINQLDNNIVLSDSELDLLYKQYNNKDILVANFNLSGAGYENIKLCNIILKGNQKTAKLKLDENIKRGKIYINSNGTWKKAVIWIKDNETWKRGM